MKRIHYGSTTIDTTNEIADLLFDLAQRAAGSKHYRSRPISNGVMSESYAIGRTVPVALVGYVDGAPTDTQISVLIGVGIPLAVSDSPVTLADPAHAEIVRGALQSLLDGLPDPD